MKVRTSKNMRLLAMVMYALALWAVTISGSRLVPVVGFIVLGCAFLFVEVAEIRRRLEVLEDKITKED